MKREIRLQMRLTPSSIGGPHPVYQIQLPVAFVRKFGWQKGDVLSLRSQLFRNSIVMSRS